MKKRLLDAQTVERIIRLRVRKETVRTLGTSDLQLVHGGEGGGATSDAASASRTTGG
jgi:hypothetical protein